MPLRFSVNQLQRSVSNILNQRTKPGKSWSSTIFDSIGTGRGETKSIGSVVTTIRRVAVRPLLFVRLRTIRLKDFTITLMGIKRQMNYNYFSNKRFVQWNLTDIIYSGAGFVVLLKTNADSTLALIAALFSVLGEEGEQHTLTYAKTQRGGRMLVFEGYSYVENRQSSKRVFWRCNKYMKFECRARVVTSKLDPNEIRILARSHTHPPQRSSDTSWSYEEELKE